jgi:hypothetical protein
MQTDNLDREAYRRWWEAEGRGDLSVCPCGQPAEDLVYGNARLPAGHGLCPRHRFDVSGADREAFAQWIIAGTFSETDLSETDELRARLFADGFLGSGPN